VRIVMLGCRGIPATYGGVEKVVEELSVGLAKRGHEVSVICRDHYTPKMRAYQNVDLIRLPTVRQKHLEMIVHSLLSALYVCIKKYDVVHIHSVEPAVVSIFLKLFHPIVATSHGQAYRRDKWGRVFKRMSKAAERTFIRSPRVCTAVSRTLCQYYFDRYKRDVQYIPNGVKWQALLGPSHIRRFGLDKDGYILFVGRLIPTKGAELLIDAYNKIRPKVKLVIVGASSHTNGYEKKLRSKAGNDVLFLGYQYGEQLRALYSNCKLFVFPSLIEGLPMVLLEAFSFLRPTIYSDIPENTEIADGLGIAFRSGDVEDLADKLSRVLSNGGELNARDTRIYEKLHSEYNWERIVDKYIEVYQTAVNRHRFDSSRAESAL